MNEYVVLHGIGDLRIEREPVPEVEPHEVLLKMSTVGLCGSDLSNVYKGYAGDHKATFPLSIGHEASGVVTKCGSAVKHLKPGDRVVVEPGGPCRICNLCTSGKYNICKAACFHGKPSPGPACLARYFKHQADLCFKLPDNVSQEEGAIIEPLAVGIHACRRANITLGSSVLICGAGPIGLVNLLSAKAMGATNILVTDIRDSRLEMAKSMGATHTMLVMEEDPQILAQKVEYIMGCMPESTLECTGVESSLSTAIYATRSGGVLVLVGIGGNKLTLPIVNAAVREVDIRGVYRYTNCYPTAINMVAKGLIDVKPLITHRFRFDEFKKAFEVFRAGTDGAIKCMISCE
ncbi:sorbitol dehydrogenase-like [Macrobrachium rosenbergii]|uniref:sorbitol dehydrogenase-like n=1 Tax=Macrobrachium rosenbergii TaxID=79674 RepID=UPI0034D43EA6